MTHAIVVAATRLSEAVLAQRAEVTSVRVMLCHMLPGVAQRSCQSAPRWQSLSSCIVSDVSTRILCQVYRAQRCITMFRLQCRTVPLPWT
ncbi:uncharacterized protein C8Q71DRAFT_762327 [Rhodofomes roseus]|uniref:Secreted protein n=1 Tax=Rhodofomes roseus TaxID=34475 RepID=A0ABQ8KGL6_9APHY|nr:uncharacterized protein C8Q71DRAFT_762327 [Rhodofomes roseus]KAH9836387.1 hypothetical protein C8Q71DRAFT_762327 [Rhodofomes roseus]